MKSYEQFYIGGAWVDPTGSERIDVLNPATEQVIGRVAAGNAEDIHAAVMAARNAFDSWSTTPARERADFLKQTARALHQRSDELAALITEEMGMPSAAVHQNQVDSAIQVFSDYGDLLEDFPFEQQYGRATLMKEPIGVCGFITPWNYPLLQIAGKVAPAIAAGCTVVLKPSEIAPLDAAVLSEVFDALGLPRGVFNLVNGYGPVAGAALAEHPEVDMVSFTGSTRAGVSVAKAAADTVKRVTQELGGKSPNIILDDADFDTAVAEGVESCFINSGQCCDAPTRMLVPAARHDEAVAIAKKAAEAMKVGNPNAPSTDLGPLVSAAQLEKVRTLVQKGIDEGAELVTGGAERPDGLPVGYYVKPTVFANVRNEMSIAQEEVFGPVLTIIPYGDEEEAISLANDTEYGLAGYVSSGDTERARRVAARMRAGQIHINGGDYDSKAPFGGYKMSGNGREFGPWGLEEYLETKAVMGG